MTAEKYVHRLMIQTVRMSDAGQYSVVAGSSVSKAQLIVEGRDIRISEPAEREITVRRTFIFSQKDQYAGFRVDSLFLNLNPAVLSCRFWRNTEPPSSLR